MKAEFPVEVDVFGAVGEGEEPGLRDAPALEGLASRGHQRLRQAAIPAIDRCGQRAEKTDAAPARGEIRADDHAVVLGDKGLDMLGAKPVGLEIAVEPVLLRVRHAKKSSEGNAGDPPGLRQVVFCERSNDRHEIVTPFQAGRCYRSAAFACNQRGVTDESSVTSGQIAADPYLNLTAFAAPNHLPAAPKVKQARTPFLGVGWGGFRCGCDIVWGWLLPLRRACRSPRSRRIRSRSASRSRCRGQPPSMANRSSRAPRWRSRRSMPRAVSSAGSSNSCRATARPTPTRRFACRAN